MSFSAGNFQHFLNASPIPMWIYDTGTLRFVWVNAAAAARYGYSAEEFVQMGVLDVRPAAERQLVAELARSENRTAANLPRVWTHLTRSGTPLSVRVTTVDMLPAGSGLRLALVEDVTSFVEMERTLTYLATHDSATGLLNLQALTHRLDEGALGEGYHVVCVRLQGLVEVGDLFGRKLERDVTASVADILRPCLPEGLSAFHPPNALFVAHADLAALRTLVAEAGRLLEPPVVVEGAQWQVTPRCGIAQHAPPALAEQVIAWATVAARARTEDGQVTVYHDALGEGLRRRRLLAVELRTALREGSIEVHFQPIVRLQEAAGTALKYEALARWTLQGVKISPAEFIPIMENAGLGGALLRCVMHRACELIVTLRERGQTCVVMVNVPAIAAVLHRLPEDLQEICALHGVAPSCIGIEITESAAIEDSGAWRRNIALLRYLGVQLAIDDFGTGFNSLTTLDRLPADVIKIDRTFIGALLTNDRQALICASMIRLAHGLGLKVVAEGVEDERQLRWLVEQGCDEAQGFLFSRPISAAQVLASLSDKANDTLGRAASSR
ncbi:MAG TPA: EAL domain-containing protein [Stenotrophomonas sp.]|nr:EAL domain-containing protein [Stenotrophomonas sp.]